PLFDDARLAVGAFLARYGAPTRAAYSRSAVVVRVVHGARTDRVRCPTPPRRTVGARDGRGTRSRQGDGRAAAVDSGRVLWVAVIDGRLEHSPLEFVRRPKISDESQTLGLDRMELGAFISQGAAAGVTDHALACLLGLLGLRVGEACAINIEDLAFERGH